MIRKLESSLLEDYLIEIETIGACANLERIKEVLNPYFTFKYYDLSPELIYRLTEIARLKGYPYWEGNKNRKVSCIISYPNWQAVSQFLSKKVRVFADLDKQINEINNTITYNKLELTVGDRRLSLERPLIMGILNITPDSFSDGGEFFDPDSAVRHVLEMVDAGASIIDIGAESTRPGSVAVSAEEEWRRLDPVLKQIRSNSNILISVDTYKSEIAHKALSAGANIINDISGLTFDPEMVKVAAEYHAPVVIMHIKGKPKNMQVNPSYDNLIEEIFEFLYNQSKYAAENGVSEIILDPGIGFGKRWEDNFEIIRRLGEFGILGYPILIGPSRKSFIGRELDLSPGERFPGTAAAVALSVLNGANIHRVHDVREIKQVVSITENIMNRKYK